MKLIRLFKILHLALFIPLLISISLRLQSLPSLEGRFFIGTDPYRFFRQAQIILQSGKLPKVDDMRWIPPGRDFSKHLNLNSYLIAYLHRLILLFRPSTSLHTTASIYPLICFSIFLILFFLLVEEILGLKSALLSSFLASISPFLLPRSMAGFPDRDSLCLALSTGSLFEIYPLISPQKASLRPRCRALPDGAGDELGGKRHFQLCYHHLHDP